MTNREKAREYLALADEYAQDLEANGTAAVQALALLAIAHLLVATR